MLAKAHPVLHAALAEGWVLTKSEALQVAKWIRVIAEEYRGKAEELVVAAARAGADLRALAKICGEIRDQTAKPDPDPGGENGEDGEDPDRAVSVETTFEGAGVIRGDLSARCAAMVQAVLDALSAPQGGGDLRTRPQRYHDALEEAMRRLLASNLLPQRAGQPVKALVHISFADLCQLDVDSGVQEKWIAEYRARWAAHRAAASVSTGDGGAWLDGEKARKIACDAMLIPVVTGDIDPGAVEELIVLCVQYHRIRTQAAPDGQDTPDAADSTDAAGSTDGTSSTEDTGSALIPAGLTGNADRDARQAALAVLGTATTAQASTTTAQVSAIATNAGLVVPGGMAARGAASAAVPATELPSCRAITYRGSAGAIYVQTSPGGYVVWGIYMYNRVLDSGPWWVDVYVGNRRVDHKQPPRQVYAPHGSLPPKIAKKGSVFRISALHYANANRTWYGNIPNGCIIP